MNDTERGSSTMKNKQPNMVMIMADQMAFDVIGALGHPAVKTPNIDKLVESGVTFDNAYCNSPICAPSRASFVSGKLTSNIAVYDNGSELSADTPTFLHHLRNAGYETVLAGKMHFIGPDQHHGFEKRITGDIHTTGFDLTPDWTKGVYHNHGTGVKRLKNPGVSEINNNLDYDARVLNRSLEQIRSFKRRKEEEKRPFFLCSSFFHPHDPFHITEEYWNMYDDVEIPSPAVDGHDLDEMHPFNQWIQIHHELDICQLTDEEIEKNRRAYYGMVTYFDRIVGEIVNELERLNMLKDTIIMVTSDHGEMLGEHGMWFKRTFYDPATKIPLVISCPERFQGNRTVSEVVSLVDLAATCITLAEAPGADEWIEDIDGNSFEALLYDKQIDWKDEVIAEYYGEGAIEPLIMIRKGNYKFVYIHQQEPLLFDLETDPHELNNLAQDVNYQNILQQLKKRIHDEFDVDTIKQDIIKSQKERLFLAKTLNIGEKTDWQVKK
ncbi:choline-sulfatase [Gracilibacillus salitolerans]|uniref:Choline-sulfatase n=2 Tax=Gracilibacillus salitolerans TaxID=2663022 RepID=A0A5Q2TI56_9BACI|nr:choline-sulfatase [Gracilibacillus salitolerans]